MCPLYKRLQSLTLLLLFTSTVLLAKGSNAYDYHIDLNDIQDNRYQVVLSCEDFASDTLMFHFPWIIPGTYSEANYGKFIHDLEVYGKGGEPIATQKQGKNSYLIPGAKDIKRITYWVAATWDGKRRKTIWPMAGTGIIEDHLFIINAGGVFGYFEGEELNPVKMTYDYPKHLYAMTVLDQQPSSPGRVTIHTKDYHELIDSPIMFAPPDTASFRIQDTEVLIGFAHESDETERAGELLEALEPSMEAIGSYLDSLPAEKYAYLIYYANEYELGRILDNPRFIGLKFAWYLLRNGMPMGGALEHNKSSFYYLPDPGSGYTEMIHKTVEDIAIHEFMHILTPLNLRSQYVDHWDYNEPQLSKHLWLYEGVTEYMSKIIQANGGIESPKEFILSTMYKKLRSGEKNYPFSEVSFTEMSANVLDKQNQKIYVQVYERGAVLGMLLDIEIIRLTNGEKRLIDVMLELIDEYGQKRAMDEVTLVDAFVEKVHPDLKSFFQNYVEGHEAIPYADILKHVGVSYVADTTLLLPRHPTKDNDLKTALMAVGDFYVIKKVGKDEPIGFKAGDRLKHRVYSDVYFDDFGDPLPEGMVVTLPVERDGQDIFLQDSIRYIEKSREHYMTIMRDASPSQERFFNIWLGFEDPGSGSDEE
ncbi:MAG: hypothetical protein K9M49_08495 [Candidatus Marinimicrobia bacterium]|nr:hypothetical protein [Candidatus Neomarinimicrobiota bacterium]MCF7850901.1 hypothetical protein [Candidatus Neomarinimicrobiota bacterium]MCF7905175.1 hypothetical protein [Candidatus Neomarinimicrobiota bacterium]